MWSGRPVHLGSSRPVNLVGRCDSPPLVSWCVSAWRWARLRWWAHEDGHISNDMFDDNRIIICSHLSLAWYLSSRFIFEGKEAKKSLHLHSIKPLQFTTESLLLMSLSLAATWCADGCLEYETWSPKWYRMIFCLTLIYKWTPIMRQFLLVAHCNQSSFKDVSGTKFDQLFWRNAHRPAIECPQFWVDSNPYLCRKCNICEGSYIFLHHMGFGWNWVEKREKYIQYPYLICSVKSLHSNITFKLQEASPSIEWLGKPGVSNKSAVTYLNGRWKKMMKWGNSDVEYLIKGQSTQLGHSSTCLFSMLFVSDW